MSFVPLRLARRALLLGFLAAGWATASAADRPFSVTFVEPDRFSDIGERGLEQERNLRALATALERVATPLIAPGVTLHLDVLDVNLAGTVRLTVPRRNIRIVRGNADGPRMAVRYVFTEGDRVVASGEDQLVDPSFPNQMFSAIEKDDALRFEKRMFKDWLETRFGVPTASAK